MVIGIGGGSGAGKSTLGDLLAKKINAKLISTDKFFKDPRIFPRIFNYPDYDRAEAINWERLIQDIQSRLSRGGNVIIEGFLVFVHPTVRNLLGFKIFIDLDEDEMIKRRIIRDPDTSLKYIDIVVRERYRVLVKPTKKFADLVLDGGKPVDELVSKILTRLPEIARP